MITDEKLLRTMMRTSALARRKHADGNCVKGQGIILDRLCECVGVTQQTIADGLSMRPQSVSEALIAMEEKGLIRREHNPEDKRSMLIYLTEHGREIREKNAVERAEHAKIFFSSLTEEEKETLYSILKQLCRANNGKECEADENTNEKSEIADNAEITKKKGADVT